MNKSLEVKGSGGAAWVTTICAQISNGDYKNGLKSFERWAQKEMTNHTDGPSYEIARGVYMILTLIESSLQEEFGIKWQRRTPSRESPSERCGFCLKPKLAVTKLIAGARAYICDGCIRECFQVINESEQSIRSRPETG